MNVNDLDYSNVVIEVYRHRKDNYSRVTVLIYKDKVNIEAYDTCPLDVTAETTTKNRILKVLGFNDDFIGHYNEQ